MGGKPTGGGPSWPEVGRNSFTHWWVGMAGGVWVCASGARCSACGLFVSCGFRPSCLLLYAHNCLERFSICCLWKRAMESLSNGMFVVSRDTLAPYVGVPGLLCISECSRPCVGFPCGFMQTVNSLPTLAVESLWNVARAEQAPVVSFVWSRMLCVFSVFHTQLCTFGTQWTIRFVSFS